MPNGVGGWGQPGQRETISRGERTDPRAVITQAVAMAAVAMVLIVIVMGAVLLLSFDRWRDFDRYMANNWRWMILIPVIPWPVGCIVCIIVLVYEIFDPNYPAPRNALESSRIVWPWSGERVQPKQPPIRAKTPLTIDFGLDEDKPDAH